MHKTTFSWRHFFSIENSISDGVLYLSDIELSSI